MDTDSSKAVMANNKEAMVRVSRVATVSSRAAMVSSRAVMVSSRAAMVRVSREVREATATETRIGTTIR